MNSTTILNHLEKLVEFYPVTSNQEAVRELLLYCQNNLAGAGFATEIIEYKGVYSLFGSTQGTKCPKVLLQGHVDVLPSLPTQRSLKQVAGKAVGRGTFDMLFAVAVYLSLFNELKDQLAGLDVGIMLVGDEEAGGANGTKALVAQGYGAEVCILPDAGDGFGKLSVGSKGVYNFDLVVKGKAHHGSRPWEGDGAATKLVILLGELLEEFDTSSQENSTISITQLQAGDSANKAPSEAEAHIDIRYSDKSELARIKKVVKKLCKKYQGRIDNLLLASAFKLDTENYLSQEFVTLYKKHAGGPVEFVRAHGSSDALFFSEKGIPVMMLRPLGGGAHADNEWIDIKEMTKMYQLLKEYLLKVA